MSGHYSILNNEPGIIILILIHSLILIPTEAAEVAVAAAAAAKQLNTDKSHEKAATARMDERIPNSWAAEINVSTASNALSLRLRELPREILLAK